MENTYGGSVDTQKGKEGSKRQTANSYAGSPAKPMPDLSDIFGCKTGSGQEKRIEIHDSGNREKIIQLTESNQKTGQKS